jgi:deoxyinosine 3'endonuclease (endonuclease V)
VFVSWRDRFEAGFVSMAKRYLLHLRHEAGDIFDGRGVLHCQTVGLAFYPSFVDEHAGVGCEALGGRGKEICQGKLLVMLEQARPRIVPLG